MHAESVHETTGVYDPETHSFRTGDAGEEIKEKRHKKRQERESEETGVPPVVVDNYDEDGTTAEPVVVDTPTIPYSPYSYKNLDFGWDQYKNVPIALSNGNRVYAITLGFNGALEGFLDSGLAIIGSVVIGAVGSLGSRITNPVTNITPGIGHNSLNFQKLKLNLASQQQVGEIGEIIAGAEAKAHSGMPKNMFKNMVDKQLIGLRKVVLHSQLMVLVYRLTGLKILEQDLELILKLNFNSNKENICDSQ